MSMNSTIGNPQDFAIEYLVSKPSCPPFGKCRLWLGKVFLGDLEDENYLSTTCYFLENILKNKERLSIDDEFHQLSDSEIFHMLLEDKLDDSDKHEFLPISGFDAFYKYIYRQNDCLHIVWMLGSQLRDEEVYRGYPARVCSAKIKLATYEEVVSTFRNKLEEVCPF